MLNSDELVLDKIVQFVVKNIPAYQGKQYAIKRLIGMHITFGTFDVMWDKDGDIMACVRWNITESGKGCSVLDLVINPKYKFKGFYIMKRLIAKNWVRFPLVEFIQFKRGIKYPLRGKSLYKIKDLLKKRS